MQVVAFCVIIFYMAELESQPKSIQSLYSWYAEGRLWVNRRYQRKLVWTLEEKQKLIESVLKKYPIPAVLLVEREEGGYEIIDGLQRIHTLMSYIEMQFPDKDDRYFSISEFPTANTRALGGVFEIAEDVSLLSGREVGAILDYSMAVSVMRGATHDEVDDVFARINTYGHRLSDQERRQAGVKDDFSNLVRDISCSLRGDVSGNTLGLSEMPSISIDLPKSRHGYEVSAKEVFWVEHGILRSTDLRDSMDEQCVADIAASISGGVIIPRSKDALDQIYQSGSSEARSINEALAVYGADKLAVEFKFIIDEIRKLGAGDKGGKLRDLLYARRTTNPFQAMFTVLFIAVHELLIGENKLISNYGEVRNSLDNLASRLDTSRRSISSDERRQNVNLIKGLIRPHLVDGSHDEIYGEYSAFDVDEAIRRSEIEAAHYELKQGILRLDGSNEIDENMIPKILRTICAIANNGKGRSGSIYLGVADKYRDVERIKELHGIDARKVGRKHVVGVQREAEAMGEGVEDYVGRIKNGIRNSNLSEPLKSDVLSSITYSDYFGLGVLIVKIPPQSTVSSLGENVYIREADDTKEVVGLGLIDIANRFK